MKSSSGYETGLKMHANIVQQNNETYNPFHRFILYDDIVEITIMQIIICLSATTCYQNATNKIFIQRSMLQRSFFITKELISHSHHFLNHFTLRK